MAYESSSETPSSSSSEKVISKEDILEIDEREDSSSKEDVSFMCFENDTEIISPL